MVLLEHGFQGCYGNGWLMRTSKKVSGHAPDPAGLFERPDGTGAGTLGKSPSPSLLASARDRQRQRSGSRRLGLAVPQLVLVERHLSMF